MIQVLIAIAQLCLIPNGLTFTSLDPITKAQLKCQHDYINCYYNKVSYAKARKESYKEGELLAECVIERRE